MSKKYEYKIINWRDDFELDELGKNGWRLVCLRFDEEAIFIKEIDND